MTDFWGGSETGSRPHAGRPLLPGSLRRAAGRALRRCPAPPLLERLLTDPATRATDLDLTPTDASVVDALGRLPHPIWTVVSDLPGVPELTDLDHLVIGPPGVHAVSTVRLLGTVEVLRRSLLVNGVRTDHVFRAARAAARAQAALRAATGSLLQVRPVLVCEEAEVVGRQDPEDVVVLGPGQVRKWFLDLPTGRLTPDGSAAIARHARDPRTWGPAPAPEARG